MMTDNADSKQHAFTTIIYRFLGGATLGILTLLIPAIYSSSNDFGLAQVSIAFVLVISCGLLATFWGEKFTDMIMRVLNSTGL